MFRIYGGVVCGLWAMLAGGCVTLPDMSQSNIPNINSGRRAYVNDPAANDSLMSALVNLNGGLRFVLQPGKNYNLRLTTSFAGDKLSLFEYGNGYGNISAQALGTLTGTLTATTVDSVENFSLLSTQTQAGWFVGILAGGTTAAQRIAHVSLVSLDTAQSYSLSVNLIMVGKLSGLPDSASRVAFADSFFSELGSIYQGANGLGFNPPVVFNWTYSIVSPESAAVVMNFGSTYVPLPGTRVAGAANIYLVDSISYANLLPGEEILGFSPREVVDMSTDPESRIILSAGAAVHPPYGYGSITAAIPSLGTTTAHELGHFFGLRHPTATIVDLSNDNDQSNRDDGFASTPLCQELSKKAAEHITTAAYNNRGYCLYVAGAGCPSDCDWTNLMFAYSCSNPNNPADSTPRQQRILTSEQQNLFRKNLALLQGL